MLITMTFKLSMRLEKLEIFNEELKQRNAAAAYYTDNINSDLQVPYTPKGYYSSWAQYSLVASSETERLDIMSRLSKVNIPSMVYYKLPLHMQQVFKNLGYSEGDFPFSEEISKRIFSIPMHPYLNRKQQDKIIKVLNNG